MCLLLLLAGRVGLFASLSCLAFGTVDGNPKAAIPKVLRQHKSTDSSVLSRSRLEQQTQNKHSEYSSIQQEHFLTSSLRSDGILPTRQIEEYKDEDEGRKNEVGGVEEEGMELQCEEKQRLFQVEVFTDKYPNETSWALVDVISEKILWKKDFFFENGESRYVEKTCLESNHCFQFTIYDSDGNGLCCEGGQGFYKVEYDNQLIKEGAMFGKKEESNHFGDRCHPSSPLQSWASPSPFVSILSPPTESQASPKELTDFISLDHLNRRFFPFYFPHEDTPKGDVSYETWPNCTDKNSEDRVGCVLIPKSEKHNFLKSPSWAGTLYSGKPPICKHGRCEMQVPASNNALQIDISGSHNRNLLQSKAEIEFLSSDEAIDTTVVKVADVDADGWPDIIIGNWYLSNQLLMNQGNGSFKEVAGGLPYDDDSDTMAIGLGDINNDGFIDLIIGNFYSQNKLLLNQGDGTFEEKLNTFPDSIAMNNCDIAVADVNSDGLLDVIFGNWNRSSEVLLNQGNSTFVEVSGAISDIIYFTGYIEVADVNGDNHIDIILASWRGPVQVLLNQGNGVFEELEGAIPSPLSNFTSATAIAVGDLDGDGRIDLVIGDDEERTIQILLNQGGGIFEERKDASNYGIEITPSTIAIADIDGDGRVDILVGFDSLYPNHLLQNLGGGHFQIVVNGFHDVLGKNENIVYLETASIAVSDINADGQVDVIFGYIDSHAQVILNEKGIGAYLETLDAIPGKYTTSGVAVADLDRDGLPDLVFSNYGQPNQVLLNQGNETFKEVISDVSLGNTKTNAVAVGDLNGDGLPDIVFSNDAETQLMLNQGHGIFKEYPIPGHEKCALALADVNGDGYLDIILGGGVFQVLINQSNATFKELIGAIPGDFNACAIAVADLNNDGSIDIIIGNVEKANQLLLNQGDGMFQEIEGAIPEEYVTGAIAVADVNGDGLIDIIIGNDEPNQLLLNRGNATFEELVGALPNQTNYDVLDISVADVNGDNYPDLFIGNNFAPNQLLLNKGDGTFEVAKDIIPLEAYDTNGVMFADFNSDGQLDIIVGNWNSRNQLLIFSECASGVPLHGSSWCFPCPSFMGRSSNAGLPVCRECSPDHIQDESSERCHPEPCASFEERKMGRDNCSPCSDGTFYDSSVVRSESEPLSFLQDRCVPCEGGTFYSKMEHIKSVNRCTSCPSRLSSLPGSATCSICNEGYLLNSTYKGGIMELSSTSDQASFTFYSHLCKGNSTFHVDDALINLNDGLNQSFFTYFNCEEFIFQRQSNERSCLLCPPNAKCDFNTTLQTLGVPQRFWRGSLDTTTLYMCEGSNPERCTGNSTGVISPDDYCAPDYKGPLCKLCKDEKKYFRQTDGKCYECNNFPIFILKTVLIVLAIIFGFLAAGFFWRKIRILRSQGFQTKAKILITFFQIAATFGSVYGMRLHEDVLNVLDFISFFSFAGILELFSIPADCIGSKIEGLIFIVLAPFCFIILVAAWFFVYALVKKSNWKNQFLNVVIVTFYLTLPGVSNSIFSVIQCEHFITGDDPEIVAESYLKDDLSIECDKSDQRYSSLLIFFYISLILWPIMLNIFWIHLIARIWRPVRTSRITPLANACSFLWRDYRPPMIFWDNVDMMRKIILTSVVGCIDMRASTKIIRLTVAGIISFVYVVFLAMCQPYKRMDDLYMATISSIILTCCFLMGIILNICDETYHDFCELMIGFESEYTASVVVVILLLGTFLMSVLLFMVLIFLAFTHPVLTLKSGEKPNLSMDADSECEFHAFFSHVWSTGQAKSHAIVRKIQLIMPDVRIWLDVDHIESSGGDLEKSVSESVVFIVFLSKGYFGSRNCRREIYTAVRLGKPVIAIYEGDRTALESMMNECKRCCTTDDDILSRILQHLEQNSIPWVDDNIYSAKALNLICAKLISNLPYYQENPHELRNGVHVPGELGSVRLNSTANIIICRSNVGSLEIANALMSMEGNDLSLITVSEHIADPSNLNSSSTSEKGVAPICKKQVVFLYLNQDVFEDNEEELTGMLKRAIDQNIDVVLLHELDPNQRGCEFDNFFHQTPVELVEEPYKIYSRSIAVPLYGYEDYRALSLNRLLCKLGAKEGSDGVVATISRSLLQSSFHG